MARLTGWRYGVFVGVLVGAVGIHCFSTMIYPMMNPEPYKKWRDIADTQIAMKKSS